MAKHSQWTKSKIGWVILAIPIIYSTKFKLFVQREEAEMT